MTGQTTYLTQMNPGLAGDFADAGPRTVDTAVNGESSATLPWGVVVGRDLSNDDSAKLLTSSNQILGVTHRSVAFNNIGLGLTFGVDVPVGGMVGVLKRGRIKVTPEVSVTRGDKVYARFTTGLADASKTQQGALRNNNDGAAQVTTMTATAVDSTEYSLTVFFPAFEGSPATSFTFQVNSSTGSSATSIAGLFRTAMAANAAFTALVVASGTATLILTGQNLGQNFNVEAQGAGPLAQTSQTNAVITARWLPGCRFLNSCSAGLDGGANLDFDLSTALHD